MGDATHEQFSELIPAYALDCLDPGEKALLESHLSGCESCREEVAAYAAVADLLPLAAPDFAPAPALKGRLMDRIQALPVQDRPAVTVEQETTPSWWQRLSQSVQGWLSGPRWQPVALIVIIALVAGNLLLWGQLNRTGDHSSGLKEFAMSSTEAAPGATGVIYISGDGRSGTLIVDGLPKLAPEQQYQLWLILDGQRASGGVFSVGEGGYRSLAIESARPLEEYGAFGVTIEPAGGSPGPTGQRVLGYNL